MLSNSNFLLLDEPTNHLDIASKEILEDALNNYEGTVLYISHDRYFINRTAHRILELSAHRFINYIGNYDYYLEKRDNIVLTEANLKATSTAPTMANVKDNEPYSSVPISAGNRQTASGNFAKSAESENKQNWKAQKEEQARLRKRENDLKKCEEKISLLEERLKQLNEKLSDPAIGTQLEQLRKLTTEQSEINAELETLYSEWELLVD